MSATNQSSYNNFTQQPQYSSMMLQSSQQQPININGMPLNNLNMNMQPQQQQQFNSQLPPPSLPQTSQIINPQQQQQQMNNTYIQTQIPLNYQK